MVEGGPNTVRTGITIPSINQYSCSLLSPLVHEAVVQNNIPAVFLEGTGRCCDLFAKAFRVYNEYREKMELNDETPTT